MNEARKYIDFAADFLIFVTACFFILSGVSRVSMMQETIHQGLTNKGLSGIMEDYSMYRTGEELVALLSLPEGLDAVIVNETVVEGSVTSIIGLLSQEEIYSVERMMDERGKITLIIRKVEVE